jgi:hypothetical protein
VTALAHDAQRSSATGWGQAGSEPGTLRHVRSAPPQAGQREGGIQGPAGTGPRYPGGALGNEHRH